MKASAHRRDSLGRHPEPGTHEPLRGLFLSRSARNLLVGMSDNIKNPRVPSKAAPNKHRAVTLAFIFGVTFVAVILVLALFVSRPTPFQYIVFRVVLALAAAGVAAEIPGILKIRLGKWLTASGALAVFVVVYFYSPANLVVQPDPIEIKNGLTSIKKDTTETRKDIAELKTQNDKLLRALRERAPLLAQISQTGAKEDEQTRLARTYGELEDQLKLPRGTLAKELPPFTKQLLQRGNTISAMDRASALFAMNEFAEAEIAALL